MCACLTCPAYLTSDWLIPQLQRYKLANGAPDVEAGTAANMLPQRKWPSLISPIFIQALTLTFLAEWGDRSQLATIVLAAREVEERFILNDVWWAWFIIRVL